MLSDRVFNPPKRSFRTSPPPNNNVVQSWSTNTRNFYTQSDRVSAHASVVSGHRVRKELFYSNYVQPPLDPVGQRITHMERGQP